MRPRCTLSRETPPPLLVLAVEASAALPPPLLLLLFARLRLASRYRPDVSVGAADDDAGAPTAATSLQADDGARRAAMRPYVQVGPDGRFRFRGLKAGAVRFSVRVGEAWIDVGAATAPSTDVKLTVPRS